jgi:protein-S-isoprenylcysteine O-methyltransferase Ste14
MSALLAKTVFALVIVVALMGLLLFGAAGSLRFWQGWLFLATYAGASLLITLWLAWRDPALLRRRLKGGPTAETEPRQKLIISFAMLAFVALIALPGLDHRFGWSHAPTLVVILGDIMVVGGFLLIWRVFRENSFTASTIQVAKDQTLVDTGPYALVRHPMYAGGLIMMLGVPLALASWWGLAAFAVLKLVVVWRLLDEESFLARNLAGYDAYRGRVRYRLAPLIW